jgi:hypothetical protein
MESPRPDNKQNRSSRLQEPEPVYFRVDHGGPTSGSLDGARGSCKNARSDGWSNGLLIAWKVNMDEITGQLFLLLDKTAGVTHDLDRLSFRCTDFEDARALLVFLSKESAETCLQQLADPDVSVITLENPWQFVALLESMKKQGLKSVALDHLPVEAGMTQAKVVKTHDFIQNVRTSFGVTGDVPEFSPFWRRSSRLSPHWRRPC